MFKVQASSYIELPTAIFLRKWFFRLVQSKPVFSSSSSSVPSLEHIARLILDQKSPSQALQTFRWASKLPNFTHAQSTYRALIQKLCTFRCFDTINQLLDEMSHSIQSPPDDSIFITIIRGLGRARMIKEVIKVLDLVSRFHENPSLKIFNSILDVLVKEDIDLARRFYRKKMMASGVEGDNYTYGILMKGLCLTNRIGDGFQLLQVMKSRGLRPNIVIYNTLLYALCKNGKVGRARSLTNGMEELNDVTFNILISAYCKEENLINALVLLEKSFSYGYVPDVVTITKVLELLCNLGRVNGAIEILERVECKGGLIDVVAYNSLIKGFCRLGKVKVGYSLLREMERKGCLPDVDTYNILISGFCESGMLDSAIDMFNDMKTDGINWNFATYDTLIRGLFSGGRMEDGFKILELMEDSKEGCRGHISPYYSVIYGLYKKNKQGEAVEFLKKMDKLFPKNVEQSLRILRFCKERNIKEAKRVFDEMTKEGGIPNVVVYDSLIHGYCQEEKMREAFEVMNEMVGHGYFPVMSTFNALISVFCRIGETGIAWKLMEDMVKRGWSVDSESYRSLVVALCNKGDVENGLRLVLRMVEKGIHPDYEIWNSLLVCLSQCTSWLESKNTSHVNKLLDGIVEN